MVDGAVDKELEIEMKSGWFWAVVGDAVGMRMGL